MPTTSTPWARATRVAARIAAFMPGASPPLVRIPMRWTAMVGLYDAIRVACEAIRISLTRFSVESGWTDGEFGYTARTVVRIEREGPVTTVILDRPAVKNAV